MRDHLSLRACSATGIVLVLLAALSLVATARGTASSSSGTFSLQPGSSASQERSVAVPARLPKADIEIAIDTTGSMASTIADAKADAAKIVRDVQAQVPDAQFAVVEFRDAFDSPRYAVRQPMTASASAVQAAVDPMRAHGGGDAPEAYNEVFHRSAEPAVGGPIGWRAESRKFVIVLGDAEPHGARNARFPGCADASSDPGGFDTPSALDLMRARDRTLFMILQPGLRTTASPSCYASLAAGAFPTGGAVDHAGSLASEIVTLINAAFTSVQDVRLEVVSVSVGASASWIAFGPASRGPVPAPSDQSFTVEVKVPPNTAPGTYMFDVRAMADGVDVGHQHLTVEVPHPALGMFEASVRRPSGGAGQVAAPS